MTSPVKSPTKLLDVVTPVANTSPSGLRVTPDPIKVSFLKVEIPATSKIPVLTFAVVMPGVTVTFAIPPLNAAVTLEPMKLIVAAVPILLPSS